MTRSNAPPFPGAWRPGWRWWRLLAGVAIAAWVVLRLDVPGRMAAGDLQVAAAPALAGMAATFVLVAMRAWRWNMILGEIGTPLRTRPLASVYGASLFLGLVSPARVGEMARAWWSRDAAGGLPAAAFSVAFDRAFDLAPMLLLVGWMGTLAVLPEHASAILFLRVALVSLGILIAFAIARPDWLRRSVESLAARLLSRLGGQGSGDRLPARAIGRGMVVRAVAISLASQALALLQMWMFARAVGIALNPASLYAVIAVSTVVSALPLSVAGLGTREATVIWALASLGVDAGTATTFSLLWLANFLLMLGASLAAFARHRGGARAGRAPVPATIPRGPAR